MAKPEERVPMDISDVVSLVLLIATTVAFAAYSLDFFIGFSQAH